MSKIKIYRYSDTGFEPCLQTNLLEHASVSLEDMLSTIDNDYLKQLVRKGHIEPDPEFEYDGMFIFLSKPNERDTKYFLNHLDRDPTTIPLHVAELDITAVGYHDNGKVYDKNNKMTVKEACERHINTFYLPKSQLHLISKFSLKFNNKIS
jgi:hypothetical protein